MREDIEEKLPDFSLCPDCSEILPEAEREERENGEYEYITYCPCGATYKTL